MSFLKNIFTCVLLLVTGISSSFAAHQGSIQGVVQSVNDHLPLAGASVLLVETNQGVATDAFGKYQFDHLKAGQYTLRFSYIGYQTQQISLTIRDNESVKLTTLLVSSNLMLSEIMVSTPKIIGSETLNPLSNVDILLRPTQSSQDILRIVPGLFIAQHAGGGKAEQIFLRGFDIDHGTDIHLSVDGLPVNMVSHAHGQGYSDLHFVIPETVEKVDFQKGMYNADKGNFATAGFVAFQTKDALEQSSILLEAGQFDTYRVVGMFDLLSKKQKRENRQSAYLAAEYMGMRGYFDSPQNFGRLNLLAKYHHYLSDNKVLTVQASTFSSQWDASGQIPQRAIDQGLISRWGAIDDTEGGETSRTQVSVKLRQMMNNGAVWDNQVYLINYNFELYSNFTFFLNDPVNGDQIRQKENRNIFGYQTNYHLESNFGGTTLFSHLGGGIRRDNVLDNELSRTLGRRTTLNPISLGNVYETNVFAFVNETLQLTPRLRANLGVRVDHFDFEYVDALSNNYQRQNQAQTIVSPKLSLSYTLNPLVELFAKSGYGFHSNDARVVVAQQATQTLPRALGADVGVNLKPFAQMYLSVAGWWLDLEQEFVYVGDEGIVEPSGETRRLGVDFALRYQITPWLYADANVSWAHARSTQAPEGENLIPLAPSFTSIGGLTFKTKAGWSGSLRYRWMDDRTANEDNSVIAQGFFLLDASLNYTRKRFEVSFSAQNLLDQAWNEAQFDTESRLRNETNPVSEIHFTPGTPFFAKVGVKLFF
ncbi:TonB-dependent receptor [uncultured Microscilla sp.]|uniref:TonB-dependent receptor n=1 Tax=uncultured Microscilla sp. TaxID=432653 RepID=UPI0026370ED9|nr:TonB-dependent receptor [uncultured Microscilla sp.]